MRDESIPLAPGENPVESVLSAELIKSTTLASKSSMIIVIEETIQVVQVM